MISFKPTHLRRGGLCLSAAFVLSLVSCASTFVPLADANGTSFVEGGEDSNLDSVVHESRTATEDQTAKSSRSALLLLLGQRSLEEKYWAPVEDQVSFAVEYTWLPATGPLGFEVGLGLSASQEDAVVGGFNVTVTGMTAELYAGPHFETALGDSPVRIYGGLGPSLISANMDVELLGVSASESDSSLGFYIHAGIIVELGSTYVGLDLRSLSGTSITLAGAGGDADYTQAALVLGFRF